MPPGRKSSARAAQPQPAKQEEEPVLRTRYGRNIKSTPTKGEYTASLKVSPIQINNALASKKTTRRNSSSHGNAANGTHAVLKSGGLLVIKDLPRAFQEDIDEKAKSQRRRERGQRFSQGNFTQSDLDLDSETEEDASSTPPPVVSTRGRGRGGRGSRGRGRGSGRGRGRGAAAAASATPRVISPTRTRKARDAAPTFPLTEVDDEDSTNQDSAADDAKEMLRTVEDVEMTDAGDAEDAAENQQADSDEVLQGLQSQSTTPPGSPPQEVAPPPATSTLKPPPASRTALRGGSGSQTPAASTAAPTPVPQLVDPEDDLLSDSDLPGPWVEDYDPPATEAECEDKADFLLQTRFPPITDVDQIVATLTKFTPAQRSTETLYLLAENTQQILQAWQDEYLELDKKTAPHAHPPKKPANGGRVPLNPLVWEAQKEADLYGYVFDARKGPEGQDPFAQRIGAEKSRGRELRQRRNRDMLDSAPQSEVEEEQGETGVGRRQRRATRRYEPGEQTTGANTPKKSNGWGGARKRGVSKYAVQPDSSTAVTPEPERPAKRVKVNGPAPVHPRIQEMREESVATVTGDDASNRNSPEPQPEKPQKRGRPAGSKNTGRRSDFGVKKGPRRKNMDSTGPLVAAQISSGPPAVLQSLSDGQNQFSIDPQPPTVSQLGPHGGGSAAPVPPPQPVSTVFQAMPQPAIAGEAGAHPPPPPEPTPDAYMTTTPLSQYGQPQGEDLPVSPSSAGKGQGTRKPRVKSEKRSQSMTIWWAERKAREREKHPDGPPKATRQSRRGAKSGTTMTGRSTNPFPLPEGHQSPYPPVDASGHHDPHNYGMQQQQHPQQHHPHQQLPPQHHLHAHHSPGLPPPEYLQGPPPHAHHMNHSQMLLPSPLAAMPSQPISAPPPHQQHAPRTTMPALAPAPMPVPTPPPSTMPAPMPAQLQNYPSPFGRAGSRTKGSGPPPLAPAPPTSHAHTPHTHISPYAHFTPPKLTTLPHEMPFKVLVPGPPPGATAATGEEQGGRTATAQGQPQPQPQRNGQTGYPTPASDPNSQSTTPAIPPPQHHPHTLHPVPPTIVYGHPGMSRPIEQQQGYVLMYVPHEGPVHGEGFVGYAPLPPHMQPQHPHVYQPHGHGQHQS